MSDPFSWSKFFGGLINPVSYAKVLALMLQLGVLILLCFGVYMAGVRIHAMLAPKAKQPSVFNVSGQAGGQVRNSADQKECKFGLLNF